MMLKEPQGPTSIHIMPDRKNHSPLGYDCIPNNYQILCKIAYKKVINVGMDGKL